MNKSFWLVSTGIVGCLLVGGPLFFQGTFSSTSAEEASTQPPAGKAKPQAKTEAAKHFQVQIAPLLTRHCLECHGEKAKRGRLDLSRKETALAGGKSGKVIVPGQAGKSLLWKQIESGEMPPKGRTPLTPQEKQLLRQWIDGGAIWSGDAIVSLAFTDQRLEPHKEFEWTEDVRDPGPILLRRLTVAEYIETVRSAVGVDVEKEARKFLPPDVRADGFSNTAYNLNVDLGHVEAYAHLAQIIVGRMDLKKFSAKYTKNQKLDDANMRQVIASMGKWVLRGPLAEHEISIFLKLSSAVAKAGGNFNEAVGFVLEAMLQSPRFIYRLENTQGDGTPRRVSDYELASRLSYMLWGGPPDEELMQAADAGKLSDPKQVQAQVQRMLNDPRTIEKSSQFIAEWLNLDQLSHLQPNKKRFPLWNNHLAGDMHAETLAFFKYVAWEQKRPLTELLNAQVTFATPRLAEFYGLKPGDVVAKSGSQKPPSAPKRVTNGLQALYTFEEGSGDTVRDVSKKGEPLNLKIASASAVRWSKDGLNVHSPTLIATAAPPKRLIDAARKSKAVTLEAWITPGDTIQSGPARILTLSADANGRNFTLGQDGNKYEVRFRTQKTNANGHPSLASPANTVNTNPTHVVYTRDAAGQAKLYVNGEQKGTLAVSGDLSNWDNKFRLALANELTKDRPWKGTLHLIAVYDRALSADEVRQNLAAGARQDGSIALAGMSMSSKRIKNDLQALYTFEEANGDLVRDVSDSGEPLHLKIDNVSAVRWSSAGLTVNGSALLTTAAPPKQLIEAAKKSKAVTLEAWITPANTSQSGPARILTLSSGSSLRNFTLGQEKNQFDVRFRTTARDKNGMPGMSSPAGTVQTQPTHVVFTRGSTGTGLIYINGEEKTGRDVAGLLTNWDSNFRLMLANESTKDRPWQGTFHLVAIYSRALTPEEVQQNYAAGARQDQSLKLYDLSKVPSRGGLLTQGSTLTVGGDEASMVARGLFVLNDVLSSKIGDPPPCVDTTPVPAKPGMSNRAVALVRLSDSSCVGCHAKFEPLAFGLEKFDGIGAFHEKDEHGNKLREDGEILFPGQEKPVSYKTSAELMDVLAKSERLRQTLTLKVAQFALGRPLVKTDARLLDEIHKSAWKGGGTYASLITAIAMSDLVQMTRTEKK